MARIIQQMTHQGHQPEAANTNVEANGPKEVNGHGQTEERKFEKKLLNY
jgi:hypothetical protein